MVFVEERGCSSGGSEPRLGPTLELAPGMGEPHRSNPSEPRGEDEGHDDDDEEREPGLAPLRRGRGRGWFG